MIRSTLRINRVPPPVYIEQITADGQTYSATSGLRLPAQLRDLTIDYTALSLVAPEKVRFRFKLEGQDPDWREVVNIRRVQYSNLAPGNYRFRVIAANNSGVWNEEGASLDFSIAPAYWQTNWFRALCVAAFLLVLWALYQLRLRQIAQAFNTRLEARVAERTRIARDLHDTLLQSFQGLLLRFQTVYELLAARARPMPRRRSAARSIRRRRRSPRDAMRCRGCAPRRSRPTIWPSPSRVSERSSRPKRAATRPVGLHVEVEGTPRTLQPIVRDEIYRIASEALRNAFRHAEAKQIEVELRYDERQLRLRVRDDGKGIDSEVLWARGVQGTSGSMACASAPNSMGGKLTVWTAPDPARRSSSAFRRPTRMANPLLTPPIRGSARSSAREERAERVMSSEARSDPDPVGR